VPLSPLTKAEFFAELERRDCRRVGDAPNGYTLWESDSGEPFSVPPPDEVTPGGNTYPCVLLTDMINQLGLPPKGKRKN
jgi:hypothetical protein